ncbi:MAG TPA: NUDIX hydrolase [Micromonosporaceae bacterium]|nr:NUDIX hydrolase [Micromonosporaceae bacterium]
MERSDITAWLAERARRFAASGAVPVRPRPASTVVLLRQTDAQPEVYLLRRATTMAFAGGMYAFPGGSVSPSDAEPTPWAGPSPAQWARRLRLDEQAARALVCAAVRELFEESGVLLAGPDAGAVLTDVTGPDWEAARLALLARRQSLADVLVGHHLVLRADLLAAWSRWVTPEFEPRRYDTYFFVAEVPAGQITREVGGEASATAWVRPPDALAATYLMLPPTTTTLHELSGYPDVAAVLAAAAGRDAATAVRPRFAAPPSS